MHHKGQAPAFGMLGDSSWHDHFPLKPPCDSIQSLSLRLILGMASYTTSSAPYKLIPAHYSWYSIYTTQSRLVPTTPIYAGLYTHRLRKQNNTCSKKYDPFRILKDLGCAVQPALHWGHRRGQAFYSGRYRVGFEEMPLWESKTAENVWDMTFKSAYFCAFWLLSKA